MIRLLVGVLVFVLKTVYRDRPIPRFYVLETVARIPYFSYQEKLSSTPPIPAGLGGGVAERERSEQSFIPFCDKINTSW